MSEATVDIRPATKADAAALLTLLPQLQQESTTFTAEPRLGDVTLADEAAQLEVLMASAQNHVMVADYGDQLIGLASIFATAPDVAEIGVAVLKPYWNEGLGSALMEESLYWVKTASTLKQIVLTVQLENTYAKRLYRNLGFKVTDSTTVENAVGEMVPAQKMTLAVRHHDRANPVD